MRSLRGAGHGRSWPVAAVLTAAALALPATAAATVTTIGGNPAAATIPVTGCTNAGGCLYAQEGNSGGAAKAPVAGNIVRWRVKGQNGTARLHVLYPLGAVNTPWYEVARTPSVTLDGTLQTIDLAAPVPIAQGYYVGVEVSNGATLALTTAGANPLFDAYAYFLPPMPDGGNKAYDGFGQAFIGVNADVDDGQAAGGGGGTTTPPVTTPPPASGGTPPPPVTDTVAPVMTVTGIKLAAGTLTATIGCPAAETSCAWVATLTSAKAIAAGKRKARILSFGSARATTAGGKSATATIKLSAATRKLLGKRGSIPAKLTVVATDAAGNRGTTAARTTLKAPKATRKR